jgi:hypothetical protein
VVQEHRSERLPVVAVVVPQRASHLVVGVVAGGVPEARVEPDPGVLRRVREDVRRERGREGGHHRPVEGPLQAVDPGHSPQLPVIDVILGKVLVVVAE